MDMSFNGSVELNWIQSIGSGPTYHWPPCPSRYKPQWAPATVMPTGELQSAGLLCILAWIPAGAGKRSCRGLLLFKVSLPSPGRRDTATQFFLSNGMPEPVAQDLHIGFFCTFFAFEDTARMIPIRY